MPPKIWVLEVRPEEGFLILMAAGRRFLCGHDSARWFVTEVPALDRAVVFRN